MPEWLSAGIAFLYGAIVGSFLNVVIYRMPRDMSVVRPPSHCPACGYRLRWWDNIPIVVWLAYRGRCRKCGARIPVRYVLVEFFTAVLWAGLYYRFGWGAEFFKFAALFSTFVAIFLIDLDYQIIPDQLNIFIIVTGVLTDILTLVLGWSNYPWWGLLRVPIPLTSASIPIPYSIAGIFAYGMFVLVVGILGELVFKRPAMGGGDIKLAAGIGANIGAAYGLVSFFVAAGLGTIVGIPLILLGKHERWSEIAFGPMMVIAAAMMVFWGEDLINWWLVYAGLK